MPTINTLNEFPFGSSSKTTDKLIGLLSGNGKPDYSFTYDLDDYKGYFFSTDNNKNSAFQVMYELRSSYHGEYDKNYHTRHIMLPITEKDSKIHSGGFFFGRFSSINIGVKPKKYSIPFSDYITNMNKNFIIKITFNDYNIYLFYDKKTDSITGISNVVVCPKYYSVKNKYHGGDKYHYLTYDNCTFVNDYYTGPTYNDKYLFSHPTFGISARDDVSVTFIPKSASISLSDLSLNRIQIPICIDAQSSRKITPSGATTEPNVGICRLLSFPIKSPFKNGSFHVDEYFIADFWYYSSDAHLAETLNPVVTDGGYVEYATRLKFDIVEY